MSVETITRTPEGNWVVPAKGLSQEEIKRLADGSRRDVIGGRGCAEGQCPLKAIIGQDAIVFSNACERRGVACGRKVAEGAEITINGMKKQSEYLGEN